MSLVIHYWIGDVQDSQVYPPPKWPILCRVCVKLYSLTHSPHTFVMTLRHVPLVRQLLALVWKCLTSLHVKNSLLYWAKRYSIQRTQEERGGTDLFGWNRPEVASSVNRRSRETGNGSFGATVHASTCRQVSRTVAFSCFLRWFDRVLGTSSVASGLLREASSQKCLLWKQNFKKLTQIKKFSRTHVLNKWKYYWMNLEYLFSVNQLVPKVYPFGCTHAGSRRRHLSIALSMLKCDRLFLIQ